LQSHHYGLWPGRNHSRRRHGGKSIGTVCGQRGHGGAISGGAGLSGQGVYRLHGVPRMHERPQAALFQALRELGYRVDSPNDKLPATIFGGSSRGNEAPSKKPEIDQSLLTSAATVSIEESSQFCLGTVALREARRLGSQSGR